MNAIEQAIEALNHGLEIGDQCSRGYLAEFKAKAKEALSAIAADRNKREGGQFREHLNRCSEEVATWPNWKKPAASVAPVPAGLSDAEIKDIAADSGLPVGAAWAYHANIIYFARALESRLSLAAQQKVAEGWVAMPKELTQEMECVIENGKCVYRSAQELYDDLIAAAPLLNGEIERKTEG